MMGKIKITDNKIEMIQIGKELFMSKPNIYTEKMCASIRATIDSNMPDATLEEKENVLYQSVYDYWVYGFNIAEEFYYHLAEKDHDIKSQYINCKNRARYIDHLNKREDACLLNEKYKAYEILRPYYMRDVIQISGEQDFDAFATFVKKHPKFVAKPSSLGLAIGVHIVDASDCNDIRQLFLQLLSEGVNIRRMHAWGGGTNSVVLEELIEQVDAMATLHPQSCNTVRVTTLRIDGKINIYRPWFKIGAHGNFVTSAAQGSLCAGIDVRTGIVDTDGFDEHGIKFKYHPQTNIRICGFKIPEWDSLLKAAMEISKYFPSINYIGWDFALTPQGWCIMEGNYAGEFIWQLIYEHGMKQEFENTIKWKPLETFWWEK